MIKNKEIFVAWIGLIFLGITWGGSFMLMKYGLRSFDFMQVASIRIFTAFLFLLPFAIKYFPKLDKKNTINLIIVGFVGNFFPAILFSLGQTRVESNLAGILNSLVPIFVLIIGLLFYRIKTNIEQVTGVLLGLLGAVILITKDNLFSFGQINAYSLFIIFATICYAVNMNQVSRFLSQLNGKEISSLSFLFIGPIAGFLLLFSDFSPALQSETIAIDFASVLALGLLGSAVAVIIINNILTKVGSMFASTVTYIIPVFAVIFGAMDGEPIGLMHFVAAIIVLFGVYLVNKKKK